MVAVRSAAARAAHGHAAPAAGPARPPRFPALPGRHEWPRKTRITISIEEDAARWYAAGLRFECTQCGRCCSGAAGYVWVTSAEISALAALLELPLDELGRRYLRRVGTRHALLENQATGDCVFLSDGRCSVYQARPAQCRSYPWWPANLTDRAAWGRAATECEGIDEDAPLVAFDEIERRRTSSE